MLCPACLEVRRPHCKHFSQLVWCVSLLSLRSFTASQLYHAQVSGAQHGTVFRVFAALMRLITSNRSLHSATFRCLLPRDEGSTLTTTIALVDEVLCTRVLQPLHSGAPTAAAPVPAEAPVGAAAQVPSTATADAHGSSEELLLLGKAVLQFAFALARGVAASLKGDPSPPEVKLQRMADIAKLVHSICQLLKLPQACHASVLALQLEAVKVLAQMPLQATQADTFTQETLASGQAWSLAAAVHTNDGVASLLRIVHLGLLSVVSTQPRLLAQYWQGGEGGQDGDGRAELAAGGTKAVTKPPPHVPDAFQGVSAAAMFPPVMLLHRLLSAEIAVRGAALPTVMQGSGFVAVRTGPDSAEGGRDVAPLLYDSMVVEGGHASIPLFNCLKGAMQVNPPQELLKRFAGELLFMGAGGDPQRYVALVGVGLALPMLQAAGLVEFAKDEDEGAAGAASSK